MLSRSQGLSLMDHDWMISLTLTKPQTTPCNTIHGQPVQNTTISPPYNCQYMLKAPDTRGNHKIISTDKINIAYLF